MKYIRNLLLCLIVCLISPQIVKCDKIKVDNLNIWNLSNENGSKFYIY